MVVRAWGRASSVLFAQEGAAVAVADLNEDGGQQTVAMIEQAGGRASFIPYGHWRRIIHYSIG